MKPAPTAQLDNLQVLQEPEAVTERIGSVVCERLEEENPPQSPFFNVWCKKEPTPALEGACLASGLFEAF